MPTLYKTLRCVVSDLQTIIVRTNVTNAPVREFRLTINELEDFGTRQVLDAVFNNSSALRPGTMHSAITQRNSPLWRRRCVSVGTSPRLSRIFDRLLFAMFAEDIGLLPSSHFTKLVRASQGEPDLFKARCRALFAQLRSSADAGQQRA